MPFSRVVALEKKKKTEWKRLHGNIHARALRDLLFQCGTYIANINCVISTDFLSVN